MAEDDLLDMVMEDRLSGGGDCFASDEFVEGDVEPIDFDVDSDGFEGCGADGCRNLVSQQQSVPGSPTWEGFCSAECMDATEE